MLSRRSLLAGAVAFGGGLAACRRHKFSGFDGYAFIANQDGGAIAVMDLNVFALAKHIHVNGAPTAVLARGGSVYALTPANGTVHEIRAETLLYARHAQIGARAVSMQMSRDGHTLFVLAAAPHRLVALERRALRPSWSVTLPYEPATLALSADGLHAAIGYGENNAIGFVDVPTRRISGTVDCSCDTGAMAFRWDSKALIAALRGDRTLAIHDVASRELMVKLPLAVRPDNLAFNSDGGQLFVTGEGLDAVVVVYPYYTPEVGETVLAGHNPGAMAASAAPNYLFVANTSAGDVSVLDIDTRKVVAVTQVGVEPSFIVITPDNQYALVLNRVSGDVAVIRSESVQRSVAQHGNARRGPLFMMIPVGSRPVSAAVVSV